MIQPTGTICVDLLTRLYALKQHSLTIIETGTMFVTDLEPGEDDLRERSTWAIARWIANQPEEHVFFSIDIDITHIDASMAALGDEVKNVIHVLDKQGAANSLLKFTEAVDFVLLDADSGPDGSYQEYNAIHRKMATDSIIVVDDAFKPANVNKATKVIEHLRREGKGFYPLKNQAIGIAFGAKADALLAEYSRYA